MIFVNCSYGCNLPAEEMYKIDKTVMGDIISSVHSASGGSGDHALKVKDEIVKKENDDDDDDKEALVELEAILQACDEIQQKVAEEESVPASEEIVNGQTVPYKNDLEYLEDNFEVIEFDS